MRLLKNKIFQNLILLFFSTSFAVILGELYLRYKDPEYRDDCKQIF